MESMESVLMMYDYLRLVKGTGGSVNMLTLPNAALLAYFGYYGR